MIFRKYIFERREREREKKQSSIKNYASLKRRLKKHDLV